MASPFESSIPCSIARSPGAQCQDCVPALQQRKPRRLSLQENRYASLRAVWTDLHNNVPFNSHV